MKAKLAWMISFLSVFPFASTELMHESMARKRKAGFRTPDYDIVEHIKYVRTFCFFSARHTSLHTLSRQTSDRNLPESSNYSYQLS